MEHGYSADNRTAVTNTTTDAAAGIMARRGEMSDPLALSQPDNGNRVYQSQLAALPRPAKRHSGKEE